MSKFGSAVLQRWDKGSRQQRISILSEFLHDHRNSTGAEIERDLGASAMLLFTRITAWLRLTYMLTYELSVQLSAISLFLQGQRFLTNFMEVGGIQTLLDILCHRTKAREDKQNALLILIHIANSGRVYREMVCDDVGPVPAGRMRWAEEVVSFLPGLPDLGPLRRRSAELRRQVGQRAEQWSKELRQQGHDSTAREFDRDIARAVDILTGDVPATGADMLCEALRHERQDTTLELFGSLFMALGQGNPRKRCLIDAGLLRVIRCGGEPAQLTAAQTLRSLQMAKHYYGGSQASQVFGLLTSAAADGAEQTPTPEQLQLPRVAGPFAVAPPGTVPQQQPDDDPADAPEIDRLVDTLSMLLDSGNVKLRFEGTELLVTAAQNERLLSSVLRRMCRYVGDGAAGGGGGGGGAGGGDDDLSSSVADAAAESAPAREAVLRRRRASGARVIGRVLACRSEQQHQHPSGGVLLLRVQKEIEESKVYVALLRLMKESDAKDIDTQRECAAALQRVISCPGVGGSGSLFADARAVVRRVLAPAAFDAFASRADFDIEYLRQLRDELQRSDSGIL